MRPLNMMRPSRGRKRTDSPEAVKPARRRRAWLRRIAWTLGILLGILVLSGAVGFVWLRGRLVASLPQLDGRQQVAGLSDTVRIERDSLGVPTIHGSNRLDVARGLGFLHAQDRFFQIDLMRRQAAGELAEILGPALVNVDRANRLHRFRAVARRVVAAASGEARALVEAYAEGINAGLAALGEKPFEYLALRVDPVAFRSEDAVLVILAMFLLLQDSNGSRESTLGLMHDLMPEPLFEFLAPRGTEWDAPVVGEPLAVPPIPGPEVFDLRQMQTAAHDRSVDLLENPEEADAVAPGSNNWAVAGSHTADGGALLANDCLW